MNMKMCLNWKVIAGLAAIGLGVAVVAPGAARGVLPLLLLAACPLSMLLMMATMGGAMTHTTSGTAEKDGRYSCPMHPDVLSDAPGRCPRCGMSLVAARRATEASSSESVEALTGELATLQEQQHALARRIAALRPSVLPQAEAIARTAEERRERPTE